MEKTLRKKERKKKKEREKKQTREQVNSLAQSTLFRYETDLNAWVLLRVVWTF